MENTMEPKLVERRTYCHSGGRLSVYRDGILVFERVRCPYRLVLSSELVGSEQIIIESEAGEGVILTRKDAPPGCPQPIWDEGFAEIGRLLGPGIATGPWSVYSDGPLLEIAHHRAVSARSLILYLSIDERFKKGQKDPQWILRFAYSNDVTKDKHMSIVFEGPSGYLCSALIKEGGGYYLGGGKVRTYISEESPAFPVISSKGIGD